MLQVLLAILTSSPAAAGPVSYEGGWALMTYNMNDMTDWQVSYSVTSHWSLGVDYYWDNMGAQERQFWIGRTSFLLKRWNSLDFQANIYIYGGAGLGKQSETLRPAYLSGGEADIESRQIYSQVRASSVRAPSFTSTTFYQVRFGLAPYIASFESLHTWIILQAQYYPSALKERLKIGPVFRFFYQNMLWELGATARGTWMLNSMVHF